MQKKGTAGKLKSLTSDLYWYNAGQNLVLELIMNPIRSMNNSE